MHQHGNDGRRMGEETESVWVAELLVSDRVEQKIIHRHRLTIEEIEDAIVCQQRLLGSWSDEQPRGLRFLVWTIIRGRWVVVVLYPTGDPGVWNLGSAYPVRR